MIVIKTLIYLNMLLFTVYVLNQLFNLVFDFLFLERKRIKGSDGNNSDSDGEIDEEYTEFVHLNLVFIFK